MTEVLNGRYALGPVVGSGGMGAVYRARDTRLQRDVAIKILRGGPLADDLARSRLRSEANLAASISHPGVAQVFDFDEDESRTDVPFIVMQFIEGHTLAELLREQGPMPADQVMSVVVQVAEGLQAAHTAGIVHRDLKPANIMLTPAGRTVLVDFGIARASTSEPLTDTGTLIGTADYMSPEQAAGRPATPQSDLYSLGVVAHHCLTGVSPFRRDSHVATALAQLNDDLPPLDPTTPSEIAQLISSMTAKDPSRRPTTAAAVALQAAAIGAARVIALPAAFEAARPDALRTPSAEVDGGPTTRHDPVDLETAARRRRPIAVSASLGAAILALVLLGAHRMQPSEPVVVPNLIGMDAAAATARVTDAGMTVKALPVDVAGKPAGQVTRQSPAPGRPAPDDGPVTISVVSGKVLVTKDDLVGTTYAHASALLEKLGFEVTRKSVVRSTAVGTVVSVDKSGRVTDGSTITLSVAVAPAVTPVQTSASGSTTSSTTGSKSSSKGKAKAKSKGKGKK